MLNGLNSTNALLDDKFIVIRHLRKTRRRNEKKTLKRLKEANLVINLHKRELELTEKICLGYKINSEGITPTKKKTDAILQLEILKTIKQLRSFIGSKHHLKKLIPNLATLSSHTTSNTFNKFYLQKQKTKLARKTKKRNQGKKTQSKRRLKTKTSTKTSKEE